MICARWEKPIHSPSGDGICSRAACSPQHLQAMKTRIPAMGNSAPHSTFFISPAGHRNERLERVCDFLKQVCERLLTQGLNRADNHQGYESGHQCVFDGGDAIAVVEKASHKRSRSMG